MADIIQLLPDSVANQIAAGEVIQRPASAVKELLENAVDAKSTSIHLIVKDAGKTLIRCIDNGIGMSETDVRMCFERHATSKIKKAEDLFGISTMGFRGEAMASIAAVAQCEVKTKNESQELGTSLIIEASLVKSQEIAQCTKGTSISIKNLFFNIPARRKFLKSDPVEMRHINEEFQRVALANPEVELKLTHNDNETYNLPSSTFRQRIVNIFGKTYNEKLVPLNEETNIVTIEGFIAKPEAAKKTRGEQYFFVNNRFIKSAYLHNAIQNAYAEIIPKGHHPSYFLNLTLPAENIDINIHPTKTEIKFTDEKSIYAILRSAVKLSIGRYNIAPSIDFDQEDTVNFIPNDRPVVQPQVKVNTNYNPFKSSPIAPNRSFEGATQETVVKQSMNWESLYEEAETQQEEEQLIVSDLTETEDISKKETQQLNSKYIISSIKSGLILVHQQFAHERILFEQYLAAINNQTGKSQQQLFPETINLSANDYSLLMQWEEEIKAAGIDFNSFGNNAIIVHGTPVIANNESANALIDGMLEHFKQCDNTNGLDKAAVIARSLAKKSSIKIGKKLKAEEMDNLIDQLFACETPYVSPDGEPTIVTLTIDEIDAKFNTK